jgi:tetratricopeptide (TPR) repeat protein
MIAADPDNAKWRLEGVYSASNLGVVELEQAHYTDAAATFQASVGAMDLLTASQPGNREYLGLLSEALAYHSESLDKAGRLGPAIQQRERQLTLLSPYLAQDKPDAELRQDAMIANMALSNLRFQRGDTKAALDNASAAVEIGRRLVELEPGNADWMGRSANTQLNQALLLLRAGKVAEAKAATDQGCEKANRLTIRDPTVVSWRTTGRACLRLRSEMALLSGAPEEARFLARQVLDAIQADKLRSPADRFALVQAHKLIGDILWRSGDHAGAIAAWRAGLAVWPKGMAETPRQMAERGEMLRGIGARAEGNQIASQLATMGYRQSISNRAKV